MKGKLWLMKVRFELFVKGIAGWIYNHLDGTPKPLRACVVVTCSKCRQPLDIIEGPHGVVFQCLECRRLVGEPIIRVVSVAEAKAHHHPAYVLM